MITVCWGKRLRMCVHAEPFCGGTLAARPPCRSFCGEGLFGKSLFLGICYAFALCSAVQEEMVALATLFE